MPPRHDMAVVKQTATHSWWWAIVATLAMVVMMEIAA